MIMHSTGLTDLLSEESCSLSRDQFSSVKPVGLCSPRLTGCATKSGSSSGVLSGSYPQGVDNRKRKMIAMDGLGATGTSVLLLE
jgi:hypothetical protein